MVLQVQKIQKQQTKMDLDEAEKLARLEVLGLLDLDETIKKHPKNTDKVNKMRKRPNQSAPTDLDLAEKKARLEVLEFVMGARKEVAKKPRNLKPPHMLPGPPNTSVAAILRRKPLVSETGRRKKTEVGDRREEDQEADVITEMQQMINNQL